MEKQNEGEIKERAITHLLNHNETLMEYDAFVRDSRKLSKKNAKLTMNWRAVPYLNVPKFTVQKSLKETEQYILASQNSNDTQ